MKNYFIKISLYIAFLFLITNCATTKKATITGHLKTDSLINDTMVYKGLNKSERKKFLKPNQETKFRKKKCQ